MRAGITRESRIVPFAEVDRQAARLRDTDTITVCDVCLTATCWTGVFMCEASNAGTVEITVERAKRLHREHPDRWVELRRAEGVVL